MPDDTNDGSLEASNERMRSAIGAAIPVRFEEVTKQRVVMTMAIGPHIDQPSGVLHGGASMVLAESAASIGAMINAPKGDCGREEINGRHIRPKSDGIVRAVAEPLHIGRTSQVWSIEIRDEASKVVCVSRCTLAIAPAPEGFAPLPPTGD